MGPLTEGKRDHDGDAAARRPDGRHDADREEPRRLEHRRESHPVGHAGEQAQHERPWRRGGHILGEEERRPAATAAAWPNASTADGVFLRLRTGPR